MPRGLVDWTVRTLMLVLAGLVTLSMLGAIFAISDDGGGPGAVFPRPAPAPPAAEPPAADARAPMPRAEGHSPAAPEASVGPGTNVVTVVPPRHPLERWLEAIAWGLMTLVLLAALALVLLFEAVRQLRRLAGAAEARGTMTPSQHSSGQTGEKAS